MSKPTDKHRAFLRELAELCRRHGVASLGSCSCCDGTSARFIEDDDLYGVQFGEVWTGSREVECASAHVGEYGRDDFREAEADQ